MTSARKCFFFDDPSGRTPGVMLNLGYGPDRKLCRVELTQDEGGVAMSSEVWEQVVETVKRERTV